MKTQQKIAIPAMNEAWHDFPWDKYPGGVKVTFILTPESGGGVALLCPTRWGYELPYKELCPNDTLDGMVAAFNQKLKQLGVVYTLGTTKKAAAVLGTICKDGALHLLMEVPYRQIQPVERIEFVSHNKAYQIESGFALSNPICRYIPAMLGWPGAIALETELVAA